MGCDCQLLIKENDDDDDAAPAWSGFSNAGDKMRLNSFLRRCRKLGYSDESMTFEDVC